MNSSKLFFDKIYYQLSSKYFQSSTSEYIIEKSKTKHNQDKKQNKQSVLTSKGTEVVYSEANIYEYSMETQIRLPQITTCFMKYCNRAKSMVNQGAFNIFVETSGRQIITM